MAHVRGGNRPRLLRHRSVDYRRTRSCNREHAFALEWERENKPDGGRGLSSWGILQALMFDQRSASSIPAPWWHMRARFWITNKEAAIAATVVQWLGTNVGMCFLEKALKACGYKIVRDKEWLAAPDCCRCCGGRGRLTHRGGYDHCGWCGWPWKNYNEPARENACPTNT